MPEGLEAEDELMQEKVQRPVGPLGSVPLLASRGTKSESLQSTEGGRDKREH